MSLRSPFILLRNLFAALLHVWHRCLYTFARWLRKDTATYVTLELQQEYPFGPPQGIAKWFQQDLSWLELRELLIQVKESPDIDGLVVSTDGLELGMARASSIRNLLDDVRDSGKHVVGFLKGSTTAEYMLATAADGSAACALELPPRAASHAAGAAASAPSPTNRCLRFILVLPQPTSVP